MTRYYKPMIYNTKFVNWSKERTNFILSFYRNDMWFSMN